MSSLMQRVKEIISPDERLKRRAQKALDIADRIIVETQAQQVNIKKCSQYQETLLGNLQKVMDGALKLGNKGLYMQTGKLAVVVGNWHNITSKMMNDEGLMIQFMSMMKTFYTALLDYKQIVKDFNKTTQHFVSFGRLRLDIPKQMESTSAEAATSFRKIVESIESIQLSYTGLTEYTLANDEDEWSRRFEEERRELLEKKSKTPENHDDN